MAAFSAQSVGQGSFLPLDLPEDALSQTSGVLPAEWIRRMAHRGQIGGRPLESGQIQPASLDLRLGKAAYKVHASFLPGRGASIDEKIKKLTSYKVDLTTPQVLPRGQIFLIELEETLQLQESISGVANPKSSTGRLDVFTRVIADESDVFDVIPSGYCGRLWAEVSPRTFDLMVKQGSRLSQIRFRRRNSQHHPFQNFRLSDKELEALHARSPLTDGTPIIRGGLNLRVNLLRDDGTRIVAYRAKRHTPFIDFERTAHYEASEFWDAIEPPADGNLLLAPGEFYILASKESIHIPVDHAAEMVAIDPTMGEFRVHYAGFFDPGFGRGLAEGKGSKAVLEVRTYDIPFLLEDGQTIGKLAFERLAGRPTDEYGDAIASHYQGQRLKLSKHFRA